MSEEFFESLREHVSKSGKNQKEISQDTGIEQASLSRFLNKRQGLSSENLIALMDYLGLRLVSTNERLIHRIAPKSPVEVVDGDDLKTITVYDMAGAGPGIAISSLEPICKITAPPTYFMMSDIALKIVGHSMEPLLPHGSVVGIKQGVPFQANELYAVDIPYEGLVVKRIGVDRTTLEYIFKSINSDKDAYPDFRISIAECENAIVGRVVWVMRGL